MNRFLIEVIAVILMGLSSLFGANPAYGQWLGTTILLPDSLGGANGIWCAVYDSIDNTVFVAGKHGNCVIVIDGEGDSVITVLEVGGTLSGLVWSPISNKVYFTTVETGWQGDVVVISNPLSELPESLPSED